jgi:hypothetical protein
MSVADDRGDENGGERRRQETPGRMNGRSEEDEDDEWTTVDADGTALALWSGGGGGKTGCEPRPGRR